MNELIKQFILESRDLVEQATAGLAALEHSPHDEQWIDATFRAIHTLKGGAAIVDFIAMEQLVHAAEDALGAARAGKRRMDIEMVGACVACLDQVLRWLDEMEQSGEVPQRAELQIEGLLSRLNPVTANERSTGRVTDWLAGVLERHADVRSRAASVVRFTPQSANFFQGEDPIALLASLPQLLAIELEPIAGWPTLDSFDPFESILVLTAVTAASAADVRTHCADHLGECEIVALTASEQPSQGTLPQAVRSVLQAQIDLLQGPIGPTFPGRLASAGLVAANALRYCRQPATAEVIARATAHALRSNDPQDLRDHIANVMSVQHVATAEIASLLTATEAPSRRDHWVRTLRIDAERIDELVRLTGELTVVKNAIGHALKIADDERATLADLIRGHHQALDHLIGELQGAVLGVRVLPLRNVMQRFPRLVREMSQTLGKQVDLVIEGDETEADKMIVEMLFEPLLHVMRNAMDHGLESAIVRAQRNKPAIATIRMRASRQGGQVHIEVNDDGAGIDVARVRQRAAERGMIDAERLATMSDAEAIELVFMPGFSTAAEVSGISGRGVGMDAVRSAVERVGGRVAIESHEGLGTSVRLTMPFSVMLTQVLTAEVGNQIFGIPLDSVIETLSVPVNEIERVGAAKAIVRRERTIPIFELAELLRIPSEANSRTEAVIVVAALGSHLGGIRVDRLGERVEVMLKPLDGLLAGVPGITGTSILGDGRVLLVLDLEEVLQ